MGPLSRFGYKMKGKKPESLEAQLENLIFEQSERDSIKKKNLKKTISEICKSSPKRSSRQLAEITRLQSELDIIREHQKGETE